MREALTGKVIASVQPLLLLLLCFILMLIKFNFWRCEQTKLYHEEGHHNALKDACALQQQQLLKLPHRRIVAYFVFDFNFRLALPSVNRTTTTVADIISI